MSAKKTQTLETEVEVKILVIDSGYEPVTRAGFEYRQKHLYPYLESKGFGLIRCQGKLARRIHVAPEAKRPEVVYITGVGHGTDWTYTGDYHDEIFEVGRYHPDESSGKIVHFLSCRTAAELGKDFVRNGCNAYFGYDENFTFVPKFSDYHFECDSEIDRAFARGLNAGEVYDRVIQLFNKRIKDLHDKGHDYAAATLETTRDRLMAPSVGTQWGSEDAKL